MKVSAHRLVTKTHTSVTRDKLANRLFKMNSFTRTGNNPILRRTLRAMKYQFKRKLIFDMTIFKNTDPLLGIRYQNLTE